MAATPSNDKQRDLRFSLSELESMRTHELAELLSNFVLLLRRLPNVAFSDLQQSEDTPATPDLVTRAHERVNGSTLPKWTHE